MIKNSGDIIIDFYDGKPYKICIVNVGDLPLPETYEVIPPKHVIVTLCIKKRQCYVYYPYSINGHTAVFIYGICKPIEVSFTRLGYLMVYTTGSDFEKKTVCKLLFNTLHLYPSGETAIAFDELWRNFCYHTGDVSDWARFTYKLMTRFNTILCTYSIEYLGAREWIKIATIYLQLPVDIRCLIYDTVLCCERCIGCKVKHRV